MSADQLDLLCEHCGQAFSDFMHEMAAKNAKVICPNCGASSVGKSSQTVRPAVCLPSPKKKT